ncbi:MAG: DUF1552 domain-containing protein [Myxococcales bacterium]|nr:DUF1552 domain-containing protein [Myxococcales bacterium]
MHLTRRRILGGAGALVALPALAFARPRHAPSRPLAEAPPRRLLVYFLPNGRVPANWAPPESGPEFSFPPALAPFAALKADLICLKGLVHTSALMSTGTGDHALGTGTILNCWPYPDGALHGEISMDQALVKALAPPTRFPSLQWGAGEPMACDFGAACAYTQSISWAGEKQPLAPVINPKTAFDQLFAGADEGATEAEKAKRKASLKSVLDYVQEDAASLQIELGADDRRKLDEYFTAVRELEKRLDGPPAGACEPGPAPAGALDYPSRVKAFGDLIALAFRCDQSRVITFMIENGLSSRSHPFIGAPGGHHGLTHGAGVDAPGQLLKLETWQAQQAADLATTLKSLQEPDGSFVLDNTAMLVLTDMGDGGPHDHTSLNQLIVGRCGGALATGQSIACNGLPLGDMHVSLLRAFGVDTMSFGIDGTAPLPGVNAG